MSNEEAQPSVRVQASVPTFKMYYPTISEMDSEQRRFYFHWKSEIERGVAIDVGDNVSYVFCYCYEVLAKNDMNDIYSKMHEVASAYSSRKHLSDYCRYWAADALIGLGKFECALDELPKPALDRTGLLHTDLLLSLKYYLGRPIFGEDILTIFGPRVTGYAKQHLAEISKFIAITIGQAEGRGGDTIKHWTETLPLWKGNHHLFSGTPAGRTAPNLVTYGYSRSPEIEAFCREAIREAENTFREERGVPRVGEGWVSETELYYRVKEAFPEWKILHHGRPRWLAPQHLDIWIEQANIAIEYQGAQHDVPIQYFGGIEGFERTRERDARKQALCAQRGVRLLYVREGYSLPEVIDDIRHKTRRNGG